MAATEPVDDTTNITFDLRDVLQSNVITLYYCSHDFSGKLNGLSNTHYQQWQASSMHNSPKCAMQG
jgi:hypothetical protein